MPRALVETVCSSFRILQIVSTSIYQRGHKQITSNGGNKAAKLKKFPRRLAVFDFDQTVVSQDTDIVVSNLLPPERITQEIIEIIDKESWLHFMTVIFRLLHECNCSEGKIRYAIRGIPEVPGFVKCLKSLRQQNCDLIIISDSNSIFIDEWLKSRHLQGYFEAIFTNPAEFQTNGLLVIKPYHQQTDCRLSAANLCKGKVLEDFIDERSLNHGITYDQLIYAGDGSNDICPVVRLKHGDLACVRIGYSMAKNLKKNKAKLNVQAKVLLWRNGFDLLSQIEDAWHKEKKTTK